MGLLTSVLTVVIRRPWIAFGTVFLTIGIGAILVAGAHTYGELRYRRHGVTVEGTVLAKDIRRATGEKGTSFEIRYRFTTREGQEIEGRAVVSLQRWEALRERSPVRVEYLPYAPTSNRLAGQGGFGELVVEVLFGSLFGAIGGLMFRKGYRRLRVERRLLQVGVMTEATVASVTTGDLTINRQPLWVVHYRYPDPAGRTHEGRSGYMSLDEAQAWKPGDTGRVRFDPQNPADSIWIGRD